MVTTTDLVEKVTFRSGKTVNVDGRLAQVFTDLLIAIDVINSELINCKIVINSAGKELKTSAEITE